jgi:hypothetical protein
MKKPTRVTFLESQAGTESLFTRGLRSGAKAAGWDVDLVFLANEDGSLRTDKEVRGDLLTRRPDTICFLMDAPLHLERLWEAPSLAGVDKISLWFDDYYRSPKTLGGAETWTAWQKNHGVRVGIWDAYWRCAWKLFTGVEAFPIHLAADPKLLSPGAPAWKPEWSARAAFVGTIPSLKSLEAMSAHFPRALEKLLEEKCASMESAPWPFRPYDIARACQSFLGSKYGMAIDAALRTPEIQALWNHLLWRWGKRIARLRGLAAVAQGAPLAIMSGHGTEAYAGEDELRAALPKGIDLVYADTKTVPANAWKNLFHTGKFQVQITDPQSVEGGLPFRVFECAACGVPLLSDYRRELAELFPTPCGIATAANEAALAEAAATWRETPEKDLHAQGRDLRERFLDDHTWEVRWNQLAQRPQNLVQVASLATVSWTPSRFVEEVVPQAA